MNFRGAEAEETRTGQKTKNSFLTDDLVNRRLKKNFSFFCAVSIVFCRGIRLSLIRREKGCDHRPRTVLNTSES